jgi:hypothetical protein
MQAASDHQVKRKPEIVLQANNDALADAPHLADNFSLHGSQRRLRGPQQEGAGQTHALQRLTNNPRFKRTDVGGNIWQFRHR